LVRWPEVVEIGGCGLSLEEVGKFDPILKEVGGDVQLGFYQKNDTVRKKK
jgi:hypothetical protein